MHLAHLNIGSNNGDRRAFIARAVALISDRFHVVAVSDPVESAPWGFNSQNPFINIGISILTDLDPFQLLDATRAIEKEISDLPHRNHDGSYRDRDIDIDIIFYDTLRVMTPRLTIPHPHALKRQFVTQPLKQLHPLMLHIIEQISTEKP